jgi:ribosomal protein S27AE
MNDVKTCPDCGSAVVMASMFKYRFPYGREPDQVMLEVEVPLCYCGDCGEQFFDWEAEDLMQEAIDKHLSR